MDLLRDAAGAKELGCEQLRELHGDYLDGLLSAAELALIQTHLDDCVACARYDRVLRRGLELARELPELRPTEDFEPRLQHRIFHLQDASALGERRRPAGGAGVAAALAGLIALIAWSPFLVLDRSSAARATEVTAQAGTLIVPAQADPLGSLVVSWYPGQVPTLPVHPRAVRPTVFPGPYSPLIVNPPVHGGPARTISAEYHTFE